MSRRVLIVLHEPAVGGASLATLKPLSALEAEGWRFGFWAPRPSAVAELLEEQGYSVAGEPRQLRYSRAALREPPGTWARLRSIPGYLWRFRRFVVATAPDIVHVNTILGLPEALVSRSTGTPTLLSVHEMLRGAEGAAAARLARLVDGVAAVSQASAAPLRARGVRVEVVTPAVRSPAQHPAPGASDRLVVGTLATISKRKGSDLFVSTARRILEERADVEFRMVGAVASGADEAWARSIVASGERSGVRWSVTSEPMRELMNWDVFVLPTRADPFPLVVLEAMASGLPIVASAVDGVCEQVDEASGILVAPDDENALRSAIERLLDDPSLRAAMGRAGAARAATQFPPERQAAELVSTYETVMRSGERHHHWRARRARRDALSSSPVIARCRQAKLPPRPLRQLARRAMLVAQPLLRRSGLSARIGQALERRRAAVTGPEPASGPDGLPVPPPILRVQNVNTPDLDFFFDRGKRTADAIAAASARHGLPLSEVSKLLDFGCGCGRVLRHWHAYPGLEPWGSDLSVAATSWIEANLPFAHAQANQLTPPLPHAGGTFDLIYAMSVFTHLTEELGQLWMDELWRLLRPGGVLIFTVNAETYLPYLTRRERAAFRRGEIVVQFAEAAGENICAAYHPPAFVEQLTTGFEVLEFVPAEQTPSATLEPHVFTVQDLWIVRRPQEVSE